MLTRGYYFDNVLYSICMRELCVLVCLLTTCVHVCPLACVCVCGCKYVRVQMYGKICMFLCVSVVDALSCLFLLV